MRIGRAMVIDVKQWDASIELSEVELAPEQCRPGVKAVGARVAGESGGIGRRTGFRFQRRKAWGFESLLSHQRTSKQEADSSNELPGNCSGSSPIIDRLDWFRPPASNSVPANRLLRPATVARTRAAAGPLSIPGWIFIGCLPTSFPAGGCRACISRPFSAYPCARLWRWRLRRRGGCFHPTGCGPD